MKNRSFSNDFKKMAVEKVLNRGSKTIDEVASDLGIGFSTLWSWKRMYARINNMKNNPRSPKSLALSEKLKLIEEYTSLPQEKQGEFLRAKGFHIEHIKVWLTECRQFIASKSTSEEAWKNKYLEADQLIKNSANELKDKEKALAELSALLILKKKANLLWGTEDE